MNIKFIIPILFAVLLSQCSSGEIEKREITLGNPIFKGWYADPEGAVFGKEYWIYPTYSAAYNKQVFFDAFSSNDFINWTKHPHILDTSVVKWAHRAMWAPAIIKKDNKYYFFFSANDVQRSGGPYWNQKDTINHYGGIGIAVADSPGGPFKDYLGKPLISKFYNNAQPIDQFVFRDTDGTYYMIYGGWQHCNIGILNKDFTGFVPWQGSSLFKEITPKGYVEGPDMFFRKGTYYFMWSEGDWGDGSYRVAYATAKSVKGPFKRIGIILKSDPKVATGAGHNSVIYVPETDEWFIIYHRRPIPNLGRDHRVTCIDKLEFNEDDTIKPVKMTFTGVEKRVIR